jgi:predicted nucleic-acid-binding protein
LIALDTNIIVRLIVEDDAQQAAAAERLLQETAEAGETALITDPVLCEVVWVLGSTYRVPRARIADALQALLNEEVLEFEDRDVIRGALEAYRHSKAGFSDYLIGLRARSHGARTTYTFDRTVARHEVFSLLK